MKEGDGEPGSGTCGRLAARQLACVVVAESTASFLFGLRSRIRNHSVSPQLPCDGQYTKWLSSDTRMYWRSRMKAVPYSRARA